MAMWQPLPGRPLSQSVPQLYVKAAMQDSSYAIYVTDLVHVWAEHLDRRAIMRRAMDENTTIDPTNGPDQLRHLLDHIKSSLQGIPGTTVLFHSHSDLPQLTLTLISKLPAPLKPLRWPLLLLLEDRACFSAQLLRPALSSLVNYRAGVTSLVSLLESKDGIIQKLLDKLEVSGVGLNTVFPGASSSKSGRIDGKTTSARPILGLQTFNQEEWARTILGLREGTLGQDGLPVIGNDSLNANAADAWWETLADIETNDDELVLDSQATAIQSAEKKMPQRQLSSSRNSMSSTSSEDSISGFVSNSKPDMLAQASRDIVPDSHDAHAQARSRSATVEEGRGGHIPRRIGKLGKLGGTDADPEISAAMVQKVEQEARGSTSPRQVSPPRKASKLGKIGGTSRTEIEHKDSASTGYSKTVLYGSANRVTQSIVENREGMQTLGSYNREERETSQERADRRRIELKRQLEERKKAPVKRKQRKF